MEMLCVENEAKCPIAETSTVISTEEKETSVDSDDE